jgi:molybdenum cofactor synthesis domain-containing protein
VRDPSASLVVVGNEVLSAKVTDENGPWLAGRLRRLGLELRAIQTVRDRVEEIAEAVRRERARSGWVITSGGVGPTHDDVTLEAVAEALGRPLERSDELARIIDAVHQRMFGEPAPETALRMALVPAGTERLGDAGYPTLVCDGVVMLPGVPRFFRYQFDQLAPLLLGVPFHLACVYLRVGEEQIAAPLAEVARAHPDVELGSYPRFDEADHRVKLTVEARDAGAVDRALAALLRVLPEQAVLRVERPAPAEPDRA